MTNSKILEMLGKGEIEELTKLLKNEVYMDSLKGKSDSKKRYTAMKKYLKTIPKDKPIFINPCEMNIRSEKYNCFCNLYSGVLTKESCGEIPVCGDPIQYPDMTKLVLKTGDPDKIDFNVIFAEAKSKGYKYSVKSVGCCNYLMKYKNTYWGMGLLDAVYGIINNGEKMDVYYNGPKGPLIIENNIGIGIILPVHVNDDSNLTIINVEEDSGNGVS